MCGIVGLFAKTKTIEPQLGHYLSKMLAEMAERGPDSTGFALYRSSEQPEQIKISVAQDGEAVEWQQVADGLAASCGSSIDLNAYGSHAILKGAISAGEASAWLNENHPNVRIDAIGRYIEIYKDVGRPDEVTTRFGLASLSGRHAIGHTRMATESAVTVAGSHPFSTGLDQCLVHNGSLSNHNRMRLWLQRQGITFQTDNDSEVAAGYLAYQLKSGLTLKQSLEKALEDLDGFYTFCIGTADGFAVLRDAIACKPAVLAETDDWVAMGSEYRALAMLPGIEHARVWEPEPATVYAWSHT